ncbi:MAG: DUF642 domain-containing protein [Aureispira sp.]
MIKQLLFVAFLLVQTFLLQAQDNLIQNGQFTNGTTSWEVLLEDKDTPIKAHIEHGNSYQDYGLADNFVGTNFVELDQQSAVQQYIETTPGERYRLIFAYAHRPEAGKKQLIVMAAANVVFTKTLDNGMDEAQFSYQEVEFTATTNRTKISFNAVSINNSAQDKGILLTDVLCQQVTAGTLDFHQISSGGKI